jgi:hypothetical protein
MEANPEEKEAVVVRQDIPYEVATVMPVRGLRKWRRVRKLATECRQKLKELTQGDCGFRRELAAASRKKVSRHAMVAWRKRNVFRNIVIHGSSESRNKLAVNGMRMTRSAKVARGRRHNGKRYGQNNTGEETQKQRTEGMRRCIGPECSKGSRDRGLKQQLRLRKTTTGNGIRG